MHYVYDSNILVYKIRGHPSIDELEEELNEVEDHLKIISIVTKAEFESLAVQFNWGERKIERLREVLNQFLIVPIDSQQIVDAYVDVDTYSQRKHPFKTITSTPRNMGKNDLWIAATAIVTGSAVITTDGDFDHLHDTFFEVIKLNTK